ncbi:hypothetical protein GCM10010218_31000 [Streptomyces mashuensis]|uniref:Uncharacterized protein n=1 Tax=Streptomyces mashuensis TaxID=33904 RepID=A0A919B2V4_9ACTN|nr:hypothetical protein [Streptomyces mashuensis]GHF47430.1 hypothetical protein GCM10010218_31000 [Streptomyces mashuensis]
MTQSGQGNGPQEWGAATAPRAPLPPETPPGVSQGHAYPPMPSAPPPVPPGGAPQLGVWPVAEGSVGTPQAESGTRAGRHAGVPAGESEATTVLPPVTGAGEATTVLPPVGSASEATTVLPPIGGGAGEATTVLPPVTGAGEATTVLPPVGGAGEATTVLPPVGGAGEATTVLPPIGGGAAGAGEATTVLPPVGGNAASPQAPGGGHTPAAPFSVIAPPGERTPPAEFDTLFRAATPTQQLPPVPAAGTPAPAPAPAPVGAAAPRPRSRRAAPAPAPAPASGPAPAGPAGRRKTLLIGAAVVGGCIVAGLGVGALLSGDGDGKKQPQPAGASVPAAGPATSAPASASPSAAASATPADPVQAQAKALDALLKDSNNSRDAVIKAVDSVKDCKNLDNAASDLRAAAKERNTLVTRLGKTATDQLPNHDDLTAQLTRAWQSSGTADSKYATWAKQADSKKGCVKGHARPTKDSVAGDRASADATDAKKRAAALWNPIAEKYGLPKREWSQL